MQAVVNMKRKFLSFDMRPGSYSDKKSWPVSFVGKHAKRLIPAGWHFIGDSGYKLVCELLVPYLDKAGLTPAQRKFNFRHSSARMAVECAFGMLKKRFAVLSGSCIDRTVKIIHASMVLHNLFIAMNDDTVDDCERESMEDNDEEDMEDLSDSVAARLARCKRDSICQMLVNN